MPDKNRVMKKKFFALCLCCIIPLFLLAQYDTQTSILTEDGIFTVSQTADGKDMIFFHIHLWDNMVKGTKYTSDNLILFQTTRVCIQIAKKIQLHCKAGIGFRCGIFDCVNDPKKIPSKINASNRVCSATMQKTDKTTIKIIFLDKVDWLSLQNDH